LALIVGTEVVRKSSGGAELLRGHGQQPTEGEEKEKLLHRPAV
jgi:hypothetical protein